MNDTIYRQDAIEAIHGAIIDFFDICDDDEESPITYKDEQLLEINKAISGRIKQLPSAQPGITLESAIDYLHSIGWMQEHDRTLTESAQPEIIRCKDCKFFVSDMEWCEADDEHPTRPDAFCSWAERRDDE